MKRIEAVYQAVDDFINVPDDQIEVKKAMGAIMVSECIRTVPLLIRLFQEVEAASNQIEAVNIERELCAIKLDAWNRIETALKAIKEAE